MTVVDKVLTHHCYSTLVLIAVIVGIAIVYETLLGYARRLIVLVVGARIDARINLHVFNRLLRLPLDYFERHPAGETMYNIGQIHRVREFITGKLLAAFLDLMTLVRAAAVPVLAERGAGLDRAGLRVPDRHRDPGLPEAAGHDLRPRGRRGDRQAGGAGRDRVRRPHREVAGASSRSARRCGTSGSPRPASGAWPTASWATGRRRWSRRSSASCGWA